MIALFTESTQIFTDFKQVVIMPEETYHDQLRFAL